MTNKLPDYLEKTVDSYNATAEDYADKTLKIPTDLLIDQFLSYMPPFGSILDVGVDLDEMHKFLLIKDIMLSL